MFSPAPLTLHPPAPNLTLRRYQVTIIWPLSLCSRHKSFHFLSKCSMLLSDCSNFIVHHCGSRFIICCISSKLMSAVHTLLISFSQKKLAICIKNIFSLTQRISFPTTASPTSCEDDEALARAIAASLNDEQPKPKPKRTTATNVCIYIYTV